MTGVPIRELWEKYLQGSATAAELETLREYFSDSQHQAEFDGLLQQAFTDPRHIETTDYDSGQMADEIVLRISTTKQQAGLLRTGVFRRWGWVAASLLVLGTATALLLNRKHAEPSKSAALAAVKEDLPPGREGAMLTLSDGSQVLLDSLGNGIVAKQNGTDVVMQNGRLLYDQQAKAENEIVYNKMQTPRGRQFQMTLPDGSKVWLNAASSVKYPVAFTGSERRVEITGEAYFDIKKDPLKPFIVIGKAFNIQVLGTGFNINSYPENEQIKATLVEGSIKVNAAGSNHAQILKPGEQWSYDEASTTERITKTADLSQVTAWKNKRFSFNGNIREVMKEIARWYDVELKYEGNIPDKELEGGFTREIELQKVLKIIETVGAVSFELNGRVLTVKASK